MYPDHPGPNPSARFYTLRLELGSFSNLWPVCKVAWCSYLPPPIIACTQFRFLPALATTAYSAHQIRKFKHQQEDEKGSPLGCKLTCVKCPCDVLASNSLSTLPHAAACYLSYPSSTFACQRTSAPFTFGLRNPFEERIGDNFCICVCMLCGCRAFEQEKYIWVGPVSASSWRTHKVMFSQSQPGLNPSSTHGLGAVGMNLSPRMQGTNASTNTSSILARGLTHWHMVKPLLPLAIDGPNIGARCMGLLAASNADGTEVSCWSNKYVLQPEPTQTLQASTDVLSVQTLMSLLDS